MLQVVWLVACASGQAPETTETPTTTTSSSTNSDLGPCGVDCTKYETPPCTISVCNTGQEIGPLNTCVVVAAAKGSPCDDSKFCTTNDYCDSGVCVGGAPNRCNIPPDPCLAVICYEETKSCDSAPVNDGAECTPTDLCKVNGVCQIGECVGEPKDCSFSPLNECNEVACDASTGKCTGVPDPAKENAPCVLTGDVCRTGKQCSAGQCLGGVPKDCSALDIGCHLGVCDAATGICNPQAAPVGTSCTEGVPACHVGLCDVKGDCLPSAGPDGVPCNDHDACTKADTCTGGVCGGDPVVGCQHLLQEGFEACPSGWTFSGDWQCGTPALVGPSAAHTGTSVIATKIAGLYSVNQSYASSHADSPPIDLSQTTNPALSFWAWEWTEGGTFDGWHVEISANGGANFSLLFPETPAYNLTIAGQLAWGGDHSAEGWRNFVADLADFAGSTIIVRFAFRSDAATVFPGVYVDDVVIAERQELPLFITTPSPLLDTYAGMYYSVPITKNGGTTGSVWSIKPGGVNTAWLTIDPATGVLKGVPSESEVGPVTVTVHVEEPLLPSNFVEKTFTFNVKHAAYYTSFEGMCPSGWTLTGDWQCGVPSGPGPMAAYVGTQCLATQLAGNYSNLQSYTATTATSPDIDLTLVLAPKLTFRMWVDTEGQTYDGFNLQVSSDGGMNYTILGDPDVTPPYPLTVAGKPAWGGHQSGLGWQLVEGDLTAYSGQVIRLRFAFQSDSSGIFPGVYIDDIFIQ